MTPVQKAIWHIETRLDADLTLSEIAARSGVSPFHLSRAFAYTVGLPPMSYVRARRLSVAAKALAEGAPDILEVALGAGYGSHEAFTRAFREAFGETPESLRKKADLVHLKLMEPIRIMETPQVDIGKPRIEESGPLLLAGINAKYASIAAAAGIPAQWTQLIPHIGSIPGQKGMISYGVSHKVDDAGFEYLCGFEVEGKDKGDLPEGFQYLDVPGGRYAVYTHKGHIAGLPAMVAAIWNGGLDASDLKAAEAPAFERYDERFNPMTGFGEIEFWVPLESK